MGTGIGLIGVSVLALLEGASASPSAGKPQPQERLQPRDGGLPAMARGCDIWVGVSRTNILVSHDNIHWTTNGSGSASCLHGIAFSGTRFVAVGNEGLVIVSSDGLSWRAVDAGTDERLRGIVFGNGKFVAVGYRGTIITSRNGEDWVRQKSGIEARLQSVAYGDGIFVAVGWNGTVLTSRTGVRWKKERLGTNEDFASVSFSDGFFSAAARRCGANQSTPANLRNDVAGIR